MKTTINDIIREATQPMIPICLQEPKCTHAESATEFKGVHCLKHDMYFGRRWQCSQKEVTIHLIGNKTEET